MTSKATEDLNGGVIVAPLSADLVHIAKSDGAGGYDSRATSFALILALVASELGVLDDSLLDTDGTLAANSDARIATQKAVKTYADAAIAALIGTAPGVLNTLGEISDAINDDANLYTTLAALIAAKQDGDADLTAIAALATTAYGRAFLTLANTAALMALLSYASAAEIRVGTEAAKAIAPDQLVAAHAPQVLADAATVAWDMALGFNAKVTLGGNRTIGTPTNPKVGMTYALGVIQDGTGTRVPTLPACFKFGAAGAPTFSTTAAKRDFLFLYCYDAATPEFRATFNKDS